MRLAIVTETFPPELNGVATTVARCVEFLRSRGHEVDLIRPRQRGERIEHIGQAERTDTLLTRALPLPMYPELQLGLATPASLSRRWSAARPALVHVATEGPLGWAAMSAARGLGIPVTADFRTNFHSYCRHYGIPWAESLVLAYLRQFHNRADRSYVPTVQMQTTLSEHGFERLDVVSRGVDATLYHPARRSAARRNAWGVRDDEPVALYVGRLAVEKNVELAFHAFRALRARARGARLVVVGDGPLKSRLQNEFPDALFPGVRRGEDLAEHYASADIFLFPSLTDTFGNVVAEAMAAGLIVVAFNCASAQALIRSGQNGLTARPGDRAGFIALASGAAVQFRSLQDMRAQARATAEAQTWDNALRRFEASLLEVAQGRSALYEHAAAA